MTINFHKLKKAADRLNQALLKALKKNRDGLKSKDSIIAAYYAVNIGSSNKP